MAGSISTLGIGSGLQLQDIIDQLRDVDQQVVDRKKAEITDLELQLESFSVVKNRLLNMKSTALDLSLSSTYLSRTVVSSDEDVVTATVADATPVQSTSLAVTRLASKSSWISDSGVASTDSIVYVPASQQSTTGVSDPTDNGTIDVANRVAQAGQVLEITFGGTETITVTAIADWSMNDLRDAINDPANNPLGSVTASTFTSGSETFLQIETATPGGTGESNRVAIAGNDTGLSFSPPEKTFAFGVGDESFSISVAADTTLSGLVSLINNDSDNPGVTASIINDGTSATEPYKLVLQADESGEDNRISFLAQLPDITFAEQSGSSNTLNAEFKVNGIDYQRQSNAISDILTGVTFTLQGIGTSTLTVDNNRETIVDLVNDLVASYNETVQEIAAGVAYDDEAEDFGILAQTTIRDIPYQLQSLMSTFTDADAEGNIRSMFDLGLEFNRDGSITIDAAVLSAAVEAHPDSVQAFMLGDDDAAVQGLADKVNDFLRNLTGGDGQVEAEKSAAQMRIDDITLKIERDTELLNKKYELMAKQFIELDRYMNQMTSISSYLSSQFDSIGGAWGGTGGSKE